ncbi:hypothetical protein JCM33374_g6392 [Metschnikowia sp. JCM 33374]|nr:hypothetical protein JCM33374_g6392 [Metschnikowia sp. JCM 33374]
MARHEHNSDKSNQFMSLNEIVLNEAVGIDVLKRCSIQFADDLWVKYSGTATTIKKILTLLEIFKYQVNKLIRLGSCDHELAYFCFKSAQHLIASFNGFPAKKFGPLIEEIIKTIETLRPNMHEVEKCFETQNLVQSDLESRFAKLKHTATSALGHTRITKHFDFLTPAELNHYLRSSPTSVLIIDFRSKKEYAYSHINFSNILNIEPKTITSLFKEKPSPTDSDLESLLENNLSDEEFRLFRRRHDFELVVMYNLKFGLFSDNKYESLMPLLSDNDTSFLPDNPFRNLIDLLMFRNEFLSSRLRTYPLFLNGGLQRWYQTYGDAGLTRESYKTFDNNPVKNPSLLGVQQSKYLRTFQDYLQSGSEAPTSENLVRDRNFVNVEERYRSREKSNLSFEPPNTSSSTPTAEYKDSKASANSNVSLELKAASEKLNFSTGLTNLGNSCYMNCILQCLSATPHLSDFLVPRMSNSTGRDPDSYKEHINLNNSLGSQGIITVMFVDLLRDMFRNKGKYFAPTKFKKVVGSLSPGKQFATREQQDCIEFLNFLLDSLHEDLNQRSVKSPEERRAIMELSEEQEKAREYLPVRLASAIEWERYLKLNFSVIVDVFQGQYVSQLRCLECQMTSSTYNSFSTLSLPIPEKAGKMNGPISLFECLDLFVETELLDDDNKWHCPKCKKFTKSTKKLVISRLPRILIIHFKRFKIHNGHFRKLENFINYPVNDDLDLTRYWPPVGSYINPSLTGYLSEEKEIELLSHLPDRLQTPPFRYKLYGVVNHFGNLTTGHYTAYVKKSSHLNEWNYFDDAKVSRGCLESKVLNQNAYCLFYRRY